MTSLMREHFKKPLTEKEAKDKSDQELKDIDLKNFFSDMDSDGGVLFLLEIIRECRMNTPSTFETDPNRMYFNLGCRSIGDKILKNVQKYNPTLLSKLLNSGTILPT